jgi:putative FmdB family regulatory protein
MPTYDYECDACDHKFELFQSIKEPAKKKCPECGQPKLRRLFGTGAAIMFKGSGFYTTDYRSDAYKKSAKAESTNGESKSSGDSKSDDAPNKAAASSKKKGTNKKAGE